MPDRVFIDTNIIIYALGPHSSSTHSAAALLTDSPIISTQVLSETANVTSKRFSLPTPEVRKLIKQLEKLCTVEIITPSTINTALAIKERYLFSWYDSLIIATALQANCNILYSEDMQNNQVIENCLKIVNPF